MFGARNVMASAVALALLAGCGGGGGSDAGPGGSGPEVVVDVPNTLSSTPDVAITSANAEAVATAFNSSTDKFSEAGGGEGSSARQLTDVAAHTSVAQLVMREALSAGAGAVSAFATAPRHAEHSGLATPCAGGGTELAALSVDANANDVPDVGDTLTLTFTNCTKAGEVMNGVIAYQFIEMTGDPEVDSEYKWTYDATLTGFSYAAPGIDAVTSNGKLITTVERTATHELFNVETPELAVKQLGETDYFVDFSTVGTFELATELVTLAFNGIIDTADIGTIELEQEEPFSGPASSNYFSAGHLHIKGLDSSVTIEVQSDATTVILEVDENGDGIADDEVTTTWAQL